MFGVYIMRINNRLVIRHRNRYNGPSKDDNNPYFINAAILEGWSVEVDCHYKNGKLYLGHDRPQYKIDLDFLVKNRNKLWIHCKDILTLAWAAQTCYDLNYFYHENDKCCLTSKKIVWCLPGVKAPKNGVTLDFSQNPNYNVDSRYICVDYIK